jgi:predicted transcriptional regulator
MCGQRRTQVLALEMMRKKGAANGVLRCAANSGHDGPQEELREALGDSDKHKTNTDRGVTQSQEQMALDEPAEAAGDKLQRSTHGASDSQHDAELGIAKTELNQNQRVYKRLQCRLGVVDTMRKADQGQSFAGPVAMLMIRVFVMVLVLTAHADCSLQLQKKSQYLFFKNS